MNVRHSSGFTLIELIIVIVILGILAAAALPKYMDLEDEARDSMEKAVIGNFAAAISIAHGGWLAQSKHSSIEMEGTTIYMSINGYPEDTASARDGTMTNEKCLSVYEGILMNPPEAGTGSCTGDCEILVSGSASTCSYTFEQGSGTEFTYNITTGKVIKS